MNQSTDSYRLKPSGWLLGLMLSLLLAPLATVVAKGQPAHNVYQVEMMVMRGGKTLAAPKATVVFGRPVTITQSRKGTAEGNFRIQFTASPGAISPKGPTVNVSAVVLEQIAGAWVVVSESSVRALDGKSVSVAMSGELGIELELKATSKFDRRALNLSSSECPLDAPVQTFMDSCPQCDSLPCPQCKDCCSASCEDGSGMQLRCCGGVECCGCGTCCSPPA